MEHLIGTQIREGCKLALPHGLKELMADISREVLRAQPTNLYKFISDYLAALLVTREHLHIACRICGDVCENICHPNLVHELKAYGIDDAEKAAEIIVEYFEESGHKEENLFIKLVKSTNITEEQLPSVRQAIENAFLKLKLEDRLPREDSSNNYMDSITRAVNHTMKLYEKTKPTQEEYANMAVKIQAAYKCYGVRMQTPTTCHLQSSNIPKTTKRRFDQQGETSKNNSHFRDNIESPKVLPSSDHKSFYEVDHEDLEDIVDRYEKEYSTFDYALERGTVEIAKSPLVNEEMKKICSDQTDNLDITEFEASNTDDAFQADETTEQDKSIYSNVIDVEDTKVMKFTIAELDENVSKKPAEITDDAVYQNGIKASAGQIFEDTKTSNDNLSQVKESMRFVGHDGVELGDKVDHCHININDIEATSDDTIVERVSVADAFIITKKIESIRK